MNRRQQLNNAANAWSFEMREVLQSDSFFWVGRGGLGVTHKTNSSVRSIVSQRVTEYILTPRAQKYTVAESLLQEELSQIKFVVPRDKILSQLEQDNLKERQVGESGETFKRKVGMPRRQSILAFHHSIDQIRSYKKGTCIEVGYAGCVDVLMHILRELAKEKKKQDNKDLSRNGGINHGHKRNRHGHKRNRLDSIAIDMTQSFSDLEDAFNTPLPLDDVDSMVNWLLLDEENKRVSKKQKILTLEPEPTSVPATNTESSYHTQKLGGAVQMGSYDALLKQDNDELEALAFGLKSDLFESTSCKR